MERDGKFILLEGQGMSGKSKQMEFLVKHLKDFGISVTTTKHPGGIPSTLAKRQELIRRKAEDPNFSPTDQFNLMAESLTLLESEATKPALLRGDWVVQDRSWPTVEVYQGYEAGFPLEKIRKKKYQALLPDLNIYLNVTPEEIIRRTKQVHREKLREVHSFNPIDMNVLQMRHEAYLRVATRVRDENWQIIDGMGAMEEVSDRIWLAVEPLLSLTKN